MFLYVCVGALLLRKILTVSLRWDCQASRFRRCLFVAMLKNVLKRQLLILVHTRNFACHAVRCYEVKTKKKQRRKKI
ncbi:hypothetical protein F5Y12DRAFT_770517 [Xylaria sp. FL1777]|nr:hypothetical protein F5Y12DRAFT_770517 [Xylaria sp. FL1777]